MNAILSFILAETAQSLQVDRGLILRLKYRNPLYTNYHSQEIPAIRVEVALDWLKNQGISQNIELSSYELSDSPLTIYAWQQSPQIVNISSGKEIKEVILKEQVERTFPFNKDRIESLLMVPLFGNYTNPEDKPITLGFFVFYNHQPRQWEVSAIEMTKAVAIQGSLSIIHQQTLTKVQSLVDERTAQLRVSLEVQAKLSEKMRHHIEELRRLNQMKDQFIANMSDALRNPLANMKMGIRMLKLMGNSEQNQRYLNILETECEKEINLVNNLLTLQKLEAKSFHVESQKLCLDNIFKEFKDNFAEQWGNKKLNLIFENQLTFIYTDLASFQLIIKELIQNAGKFSHPDNDVIVNVYSDNENNILQVINVSGEILKTEQEKIFQPFYQNQEDIEVSNTGTGLGLALVKSLVENLNGTIAVSNIPCQNKHDYLTTFTITLPQLSA
jgi:signal transduction histidine kinase